jgi:hypothetical protein
VNLIPKAPKVHFGQGVLHGDLKRLDYNLDDMNTPNPKMNEDIEFQRRLIIKLLSWNFFVKSEN